MASIRGRDIKVAMTTQVAHSTIEHLRQIMPGQSVDWYIRVGQQIQDGKMPMPSLDRQAPPEEISASDLRLKILLALCDDSKPMLNAVIENSCRRHPGRPMTWHLDQIEAMLRPQVKAATTPPPAPEPPKNVVREEEDENMAEKVKLYSNFGFYS
jgi:hypothetical protein